jgi:FG-GAP repeat
VCAISDRGCNYLYHLGLCRRNEIITIFTRERASLRGGRRRAASVQTAIWYLNNNVLIGRAFGPTPWLGWSLMGAADFNGDGKPDYLLYNPSTRQTAISYLNNNFHVGHAFALRCGPAGA